MAFYYFTDTPVRPYKLARIKAVGGSSPNDESFQKFWASPTDRWDAVNGKWVSADGLAWEIFGTGEWEPIDLSQVEEVKQKIREFLGA